MTSSAEGLELVCPCCRGTLSAAAEAFRCPRCVRTYPIVAGIPDLRVAPDPWIDLEADRAKGVRLERETQGQDFEAMVRAYWAMTPDTPRALAEKFVAHVLAAEQRSAEWLKGVLPASLSRKPGLWLDVGCGTADLGSAAGPHSEVVGIDVAFRWLVVARRRLQEKGVPVRLVCCNAEALPFPDATFERAFSLGALEHCRDLGSVVREARRVLAPGGSLHVRTVNRFSMLPEPHVGLWGVGWLPRRWADPYAQRMTGRRYLQHWPRSAREIRRALTLGGFADVRVDAARLLSQEAQRLAPALQPAVPVYERLRRAPLSAAACRWFAPLLEAEARVP